MKRAQQFKRKRYSQQNRSYQEEEPQETYMHQVQDRQRALAVFHIQAHEADVVHGALARVRAQSLEVDVAGKPRPQTALIKLDRVPSTLGGWGREEDDDIVFTLGSATSSSKQRVAPATEVLDKDVWVDRYDARLLLEPFTSLSLDSNRGGDGEPASPASSSGWSDFPEDAGETFFLSQSQTEDYHRAKRRRLLDELYERRRKEREAEDAADAKYKEQPDDETTAPETVILLMKRTADHLLSASNPTQLEMRILANHGPDQRFSFLRHGGKWNQMWLDLKAELTAEKEQQKETTKIQGLEGLTEYGSDSGDESEAEPELDIPEFIEAKVPSPSPPSIPPPPLPDSTDGSLAPSEKYESENKLKEERRARALKWMESRKQS